MTPEEMRTLYDYNAWANHRQLEAASQLTAEQFVKSMASSFSSVRDTLAHIYGACGWNAFKDARRLLFRTRRNSTMFPACRSAGTSSSPGC